MTLLRRLALKISNTVVEYASPGAKEWAQGLAREAAFIESDWAALAWALGSVRVLFDYREAPMGSLAELPAAARRFAKSKRSGNGTWIFVFYLTLRAGDKFFRAANGSERIGYGMTVLGSICWGILVLIEWRREIKMPPSDDTSALIQFYKAGLERLRDLYRSPKVWIVFIAVNFYFLGMILAQPGGVHAHPAWCAALGLAWVGFALLFQRGRRINRRRLERLEALLAERS
jgi:hypothetical protein